MFQHPIQPVLLYVGSLLHQESEWTSELSGVLHELTEFLIAETKGSYDNTLHIKLISPIAALKM